MSDWAREKAREVLSSAHPQENIYAVIARAFDAIRDEAEARGGASMKEEAAKEAAKASVEMAKKPLAISGGGWSLEKVVAVAEARGARRVATVVLALKV